MQGNARLSWNIWNTELYHPPYLAGESSSQASPQDDEGTSGPHHQLPGWDLALAGDSYLQCDAGGSQYKPMYTADSFASLNTIGEDDKGSLPGVPQDQAVETRPADKAIERNTVPISHEELFKNTKLLNVLWLNMLDVLAQNENRSLTPGEILDFFHSLEKKIDYNHIAENVDIFNTYIDDRLDAGKLNRQNSGARRRYTFIRGNRFDIAMKLRDTIYRISENLQIPIHLTNHIAFLNFFLDEKPHDMNEIQKAFPNLNTKSSIRRFILDLNRIIKEKSQIENTSSNCYVLSRHKKT